jgi:hypothetical protein
MTVWTTNDENRYQQAQIDPQARQQQMQRAEEIAREQRRVAEAAGYIYRSTR